MKTHVQEAGLDESLGRLCVLFDEELERQQNVLAVCLAQGEAARVHDVAAIEARTKALWLLVEDAKEAEGERIAVLRRVVGHTGLPGESQTLSDLILAAPEPWKGRMAAFQNRIKEILGKTQAATRENANRMRGSLRIINGSVRILASGGPASETYAADGKGPVEGVRTRALLDAQG